MEAKSIAEVLKSAATTGYNDGWEDGWNAAVTTLEMLDEAWKANYKDGSLVTIDGALIALNMSKDKAREMLETKSYDVQHIPVVQHASGGIH